MSKIEARLPQEELSSEVSRIAQTVLGILGGIDSNAHTSFMDMNKTTYTIDHYDELAYSPSGEKVEGVSIAVDVGGRERTVENVELSYLPGFTNSHILYWTVKVVQEMGGDIDIDDPLDNTYEEDSKTAIKKAAEFTQKLLEIVPKQSVLLKQS